MGLPIPSGQANSGQKLYRLRVNFENDTISFRIVKYMDHAVRSLRSSDILIPPTEIQDTLLTAYFHKAELSTITIIPHCQQQHSSGVGAYVLHNTGWAANIQNCSPCDTSTHRSKRCLHYFISEPVENPRL